MPAAVEYRGVTFAYQRAGEFTRSAVEDITLAVEEGTRLGVLGPNGGGKSTLLKLTLGLLPLQHGEIKIFGKNCLDRFLTMILPIFHTQFAGSLSRYIGYGRL